MPDYDNSENVQSADKLLRSLIQQVQLSNLLVAAQLAEHKPYWDLEPRKQEQIKENLQEMMNSL